jgi:hypothetical protein
MNWVANKRGALVNLAHVVTAEPQTVTNEHGVVWENHILNMVDGSRQVTMGRPAYEAGAMEWRELFSLILPAQPGQMAWMVSCDDGDETRPVEVWARQYPILGWRMLNDQNDVCLPILPNATFGCEVLPVMPDGRILSFAWETEYENYDEMIAAVLQRHQEKWDARHETARRSDGEAVGADR